MLWLCKEKLVEIKRMPRSQFLKQTMENEKKNKKMKTNKKKEYREWMQHQEN